jgi:hypothetical protein
LITVVVLKRVAGVFGRRRKIRKLEPERRLLHKRSSKLALDGIKLVKRGWKGAS